MKYVPAQTRQTLLGEHFRQLASWHGRHCPLSTPYLVKQLLQVTKPLTNEHLLHVGGHKDTVPSGLM
jgi:tryptophan synthase beta subunit